MEHAPIAWQERDGKRADVKIQYSIGKSGDIGFALPQGYDASLPLTIDPVLTFSTYLGDVGTDAGNAITTDASGNTYVTGYSYCWYFPTVNPLQSSVLGAAEVIISKISADGSTLLYSTCAGGTGEDYGSSIALDTQGRIVVGGVTNSTDFPIVSGIATYGGGTCTVDAPCQDNFILALNATGSAIRYSTYLGGDGREELGGIALDVNDNVVVVGSTTSTNFPTANAYDNTYSTGGTCTGTTPCYDVTVTKIDANLSGTNAVLYSTYLGGNTRDRGESLTLDPSGRVYLTGSSDSDGYPTRNALQSTRKGDNDIIITEIDPSLSGDASLVYSTYLGTSGYETGYAIARDAGGSLYLTGRAWSPNLPLRDPMQYQSHSAACGSSTCNEAFVIKLNIAANSILYSTYLGGSYDDEGYGIAVDSYGRAYVVGYTKSSDFPTFNPIQAAKGADGCAAAPCMDAFLSVLEPDGQSFAYSTFLGGSQDDVANGIRLDANDNVYIVGETYSTNFPTTPGAYDRVNTETTKRDAFVARVNALGAPQAQTSTHFDIPITTGSDDAEEKSNGSMSLTSSTLELVTDTSVQKIGLRFPNLNIPQGAAIQNAWIQFTANAANSDATSLAIQAQASDNAATFTSANNNISSRAKTTASVSWTPVSWNAIHEGGPDQRTPNLASVIQETVNRSGWTSGNAMAFIITGSGKRVAKSYERDVNGAPYLHVEYTLPATVTNTPNATATVTNTPQATTTLTPSSTATITKTPTNTATFTPTLTNTPTDTATFTPTLTPTDTLTPTPTYTPSPTVIPFPNGPVTINYTY